MRVYVSCICFIYFNGRLGVETNIKNLKQVTWSFCLRGAHVGLFLVQRVIRHIGDVPFILHCVN